MNNTILVNGAIINIGSDPTVIHECGFACREEVRSAAIRNSAGEPMMRLDDVAEYFTKH